MCAICDAKSYEQLYEKMHDHIGGGQWALQAVEGSQGSGWIYTVGLTHNFGHPELVIVDGDLGQGAALLNELGARIARGLRVDVNTTLDLGGYVVEFEAVHPSYLAAGLCASWDAYNAWVGTRPAPLEVFQVVQPLSEWCDHCDQRQRCLAGPGAPGFGDPRNRAARRARSRRRR